jgi:hypothetical protein
MLIIDFDKMTFQKLWADFKSKLIEDLCTYANDGVAGSKMKR